MRVRASQRWLHASPVMPGHHSKPRLSRASPSRDIRSQAPRLTSLSHISQSIATTWGNEAQRSLHGAALIQLESGEKVYSRSKRGSARV